MRSNLATFTSLLRAHWHWTAVGCIAAGGTALLYLPGVAQVPTIVPTDDAPGAATVASTQKNTALAPLPVPLPGLPGAGVLDAAASLPAPVASTAGRITLEFRDVPVAELIAMICMQGEVGVTIGTDVEAGLKIPYVKLLDVTPADAIRNVAQAAGLRWKKVDAKTYFVGKVFPVDLDEPRPAPRPTNVNPIIAARNRTDIYIDPQTGQEFTDESALPRIGSPIPSLAGMNNRRTEHEEREIRPIRVRNVRPGMIAWWVDPRHHEKPHEYRYADEGMADRLSPYLVKSAVDPAILNQINGRSSALPFGSPYAPTAYSNPYANPNPYSAWNQPRYQTNYQFGGGFGQQGGQQGGQQQGGFGQGGRQGGGGGGGVLELPEGVDQLVAIDAQNVLLVYGTAEGVARLQTIIEYLDRPIRQVEIEAQFVDVSVSDAKGFGIEFSNKKNGSGEATDTNGDGVIDENDTPAAGGSGGTIGAGVPGSNSLTISFHQYQAKINFLTSSGRARIINSPRVTTMNNLSANLQSQQITPIILTSTSEGIGGQQGESQNAFFLTTSIGIQVTPTINNDDTITVFLTPFVQTQVPTPSLGSSGGDDTGDDDDNTNNTDNAGSGGAIPTVLAQSLSTVANVKDNDVIVLGGLRTRTESIVRSRVPILSRLPIIGKLFRSVNRTDIDRELVIFLTARILRRSEDVTPFAGP